MTAYPTCPRCKGDGIEPQLWEWRNGAWSEQACALCDGVRYVTPEMAAEYEASDKTSVSALGIQYAHGLDMGGVLEELASEVMDAVVVFEDSEIPF